MVLDLKHRTYQCMRYSDESAHQLADPINRLQQLKSRNARLVGEETLDGRRTLIYRIEQVDLMGLGRDDAETMVWIDATSGLPAQIVVTDAKTKLEVRYENFIWNEPLDEGLFSLEPPADFEDVMADSGPHPVQAQP
jgi:outer membrane lipoprotein-sorting protein